MKKLTGLLALLLCAAMLMAGCAGKSTDETESAAEADTTAVTQNILSRGDYKATEYCTITEYKGLKFAEADIKASDEAVQAEIDALLNSAQEVEEIEEDRAVEEGDVVNIDYTGYLEGEAFEGGSDTGFDLEIGSGRFISGFEDGLIGHKKGEDVSLNLTFPDTYQNEELAGQEVVFEVKINAIQKYVIPEYSDQFVADNTSYDTMKDYEQSIRDEIRETNLTEALANRLLANAAFDNGYPESLQEFYRQTYINYYNSALQSAYGITLDQFLESANEDLDTFLSEELGEDIDQAIREDLILGAVAELEGIKAEGDDYNSFMEEQASLYSMDKEQLFETYGEETFEFAFISGQAYQLIYDSVVVE